MKVIITVFSSRLGLAIAILLGLFILPVGTPSIGDLFIADAEAARYTPRTNVRRDHRPPERPQVPEKKPQRPVERPDYKKHPTPRRHGHVVVGTRVYVLPSVGCTIVYRYSDTYYICSEVWYRVYYEGSTLVYVVVEEPL